MITSERAGEAAELGVAVGEVAALASAAAALVEYAQLRLVQLPPQHHEQIIIGDSRPPQRWKKGC